MDMTRDNNKGFSMVELIITVAIMAILTGTFVSAAGYLKYANAKSGAKKINAELSALRIDTMSKKNTPYLYIYTIDNSTYLKVVTGADADKATIGGTPNLDKNTTKIGNPQIKVSYTKDGSSYEDLGGSNKVIMIKMDKSSGAFTSDFQGIKVASADGKTSYVIKLVKTTGKHYIEE